ncbi:MAG: DUF6122 family protein [Marinirhabdus sp.]|nr:DUF6122 family protein [Marinirhabdus sp.]
MWQTVLHYGMHFIVPLGIALLFFRNSWQSAYLIFLSTMLVDLDHLFASPIFDPDRCSIGFHFLHHYWAIMVYVIFLFFRKTRLLGIGLLFHMFTDYVDCLWMK